MKFILSSVLGVVLSFHSLFAREAYHDSPASDTIIRQDSMNMAIVIVDFLTYRFESANISHYARCDNHCDRDSLPITMYFDNLWDFATVYFYYQYNGDLLFKGGTYWMGCGQIEYPAIFTPSQFFPYTSDPVPLPVDAKYFYATIAGSYCTWEEYVQRADSAWQAINSLELTNIFASTSFRAGFFAYSRTEGMFDPSNADWIIFLYRGGSDQESINDTERQNSFRVYPNPGDDKFFLQCESLPQKILITDCFGKKVIEYNGPLKRSMNLEHLENGLYFLYGVYNSEVRVVKLIIGH